MAICRLNKLRGILLGVSVIRIMLFSGLCGGQPIQGKNQMVNKMVSPRWEELNGLSLDPGPKPPCLGFGVWPQAQDKPRP